MMDVFNWMKNNKVVIGLGVLVLGGMALALVHTSKDEETEDFTTDVVEPEVVTEVIAPTED